MLTDITINEVEWSTHRLRFRQPLKFGGRVMSESMILDVAVTVEAGNGSERLVMDRCRSAMSGLGRPKRLNPIRPRNACCNLRR